MLPPDVSATSGSGRRSSRGGLAIVDKIPIVAFFGVGGRADVARAALLAARLAGAPATILRVEAPGEPRLHDDARVPEDLDIVEGRVADLPSIIQAARGAGRQVFLEASGALAGHPVVLGMADLPVLVVGPSRFDERLGVAALRDAWTWSPVPPWILGVGRGAGPWSARRVEAGLLAAGASSASPHPLRVLPATVPAFTRAEDDALADGEMPPRVLDAAVALDEVLRAATLDAFATSIAPPRPATGRSVDLRSVPERVGHLAESLAGIMAGERPTPADLADAPVLQNWRPVARSVQALAGEVHGHPDYVPGRTIRTSEIFATDGVTWVRTYSRWYLLGRPADAQGLPPGVQ